MIFVAILLRTGQVFFRILSFLMINHYYLYPNDRGRHLGYKEWACNVGWEIGPVMGLVMYSFLDYISTFVLIKADTRYLYRSWLC